MKCIRNLIIAIFLAHSAAAQVNSISAKADKQRILIGEPIRLTIKAVVPAAKRTGWLTIDTIPHFEILSKSKLDSQVAGPDLQLVQHITVTSWDSGSWMIPSFYLPEAKGKKSDAVKIEVTYVPMDPAKEYNDVKDIVEVEKPAKISWYWYLIGAVLLGLLFLLIFPGRKKEKSGAATDANAYKKALAALEGLKNKNGKDTKAFYTELVDIFRTYVYHSKGIQSYQQTTDDLNHQLKSLNLPAESYQPLVQTLQVSDFVKFAKFTPAAEENRAALETIKQSITAIENTK